MNTTFIQISILSLLFFASKANCDDGNGTLGMGGLVSLTKTDKVSLIKEVLEISTRMIDVELVFMNKTQQEQDITMLFPIPPYFPDPKTANWFGGQPKNFNVLMNGILLPFETQFQAKKCNRSNRSNELECTEDATKQLKQIGLNNKQIAWFPYFSPFSETVDNLTTEQIAALRMSGLLEKDPDNGDLYPNWEVSAQYVWHLKLPVGKPITVHHQYSPITGTGQHSNENLTERMLKNDYCADNNLIKAWRKLPNRYNDYYNGEKSLYSIVVNYILTSANSWDGAITDFTLRLHKQHRKELLALCFPGKFKKIDDLTLEVKLKNYSPTKDISVVFSNPSTTELEFDDNGIAPKL